MGCATSTPRVVEINKANARPTVKNQNPACRGATEAKAVVSPLKKVTELNDCDARMSALDLEHPPIQQERKESSLPEVDNDLQLNGCVNKFTQETQQETAAMPTNDVSENGDTVEDEERSDSFNVAVEPLNREKLKAMHKHPTQETLDFIYSHSSSSPSHIGGTFPAFHNSPRYNNRRPSGVPPPPRALKPDDFLAQKAAAVSKAPPESFFDDEEEDEEDTLNNLSKMR